jgi:transketolase
MRRTVDEQSLNQYVEINHLARQLRADSIRATTQAGSGHPTSALSAADLMAVLQASYLRYDFTQPDHPNNDRLIFSKGHAAPLLYAMYRAANAITDTDLMSLRKYGSVFEGHPTPRIPWVDAATGSLGQGIGVAAGVALAGKRLGRDFRVWCLLGDSEMAEGSVFEALAAASHFALDNLVAIVDVNGLGQRGETALGHDMRTYAARFEAFGWTPLVVDGHDFKAIDEAFASTFTHVGSPVCVLAHTEKGAGVSFLRGALGWHGKALVPQEADEALAELAELGPISGCECKPQLPMPVRTHESAGVHGIEQPLLGPDGITDQSHGSLTSLPGRELGRLVAVRLAVAEALCQLGNDHPDLCVLDAEVGNSTYFDLFGDRFPERHFQMFIAEQTMISVSQGLSVLKFRPFAATFAAFLTRAFDQIRMAAVSGATLRLVGTHPGVSIGEDGASQMALEDVAMMRSIHGSTVLYPSDAVSAAYLIRSMVSLDGISYLRATREATPVLYDESEVFPIGGSKTLRDGSYATVIAAGITLREALKAADQLSAEGVFVRVVDLYSIKPIDAEVLVKAATETPHIIVVEDHWAEGGIAEAVLASLSRSGTHTKRFSHLCVRQMPSSGSSAELLQAHRIDAASIINAVLG